MTAFFCVLLSIGIFFTTWQTFSFYVKVQKLKVALQRNNELIPVSDHIGDRPIYIFKSKNIKWSELAPHLENAYNDTVEKKIVGTFPAPHHFAGTDTTEITANTETIFFPSYGQYYLHTTIGFFKILLLDPAESAIENIVSIASFVSGNTVHSLADARKMCPDYNQAKYQPDHLLKTFFASDQPLKLHCGHAARFLAYILSRQGYRVQLVHLFKDQNGGHTVIQVFLPEVKKFAMIDPDYGAIVRDGTHKILSIQEIATLSRQNPSSFSIEDIGKKYWLKSIYNNSEPMPNFSWIPEKNSGKRMVIKPDYLRVLRDHTSEYWISENAFWAEDEGIYRWKRPQKYLWDGSLVED